MRWWARIKFSGGYGDWRITPCTDLDDAKWYVRCLYGEVYVAEWMRL